MTEQIVNTLALAVTVSRCDNNQLPIFVKTTKMVEEAGELCEAVLQNHGYVASDKEGVGSVLEESADMFFQVIDILQVEHPQLSVEELFAQFSDMLKLKLNKWVTKKMSPEAQGLYQYILDIDEGKQIPHEQAREAFFKEFEPNVGLYGSKDVSEKYGDSRVPFGHPIVREEIRRDIRATETAIKIADFGNRRLLQFALERLESLLESTERYVGR